MLPINQVQWAITMHQILQHQMQQQQQIQEQQSPEVDEDDIDQRTLFCANLDERVDDELLYELFLQAGPLENVRLPKQRSFAFITYTHSCSPVYAMHLFQGLMLFGKSLVIKYHNRTAAPPLTRRLLPPDWGLIEKKTQHDFDNSSLRKGNYTAFMDDKVSSHQQQPIGDHRRHERSPIRFNNDRDRDSAHDWTRGPDNSRRDRMGRTRPHHSTGPYDRHRDSSRERDRNRDRDRDHDHNRHRQHEKRSNHYI